MDSNVSSKINILKIRNRALCIGEIFKLYFGQKMSILIKIEYIVMLLVSFLIPSSAYKKICNNILENEQLPNFDRKPYRPDLYVKQAINYQRYYFSLKEIFMNDELFPLLNIESIEQITLLDGKASDLFPFLIAHYSNSNHKIVLSKCREIYSCKNNDEIMSLIVQFMENQESTIVLVKKLVQLLNLRICAASFKKTCFELLNTKEKLEHMRFNLHSTIKLLIKINEGNRNELWIEEVKRIANKSVLSLIAPKSIVRVINNFLDPKKFLCSEYFIMYSKLIDYLNYIDDLGKIKKTLVNSSSQKETRQFKKHLKKINSLH